MGEREGRGLYSERRVWHCLCVVECQPHCDASVTLWVASVSHEWCRRRADGRWVWHVQHRPDRRRRRSGEIPIRTAVCVEWSLTHCAASAIHLSTAHSPNSCADNSIFAQNASCRCR
ncbi:hypothetical protein IEO21_11194 [Rhodonia placenta]|uniref:Uncharacterized protein n=1 Tax=Rhodonia placenta TaxID=104341 RepID=A0A8H7NR62_9APHY|nr:hypothetical protein IEO21_11194 [Postia placenta]